MSANQDKKFKKKRETVSKLYNPILKILNKLNYNKQVGDFYAKRDYYKKRNST